MLNKVRGCFDLETRICRVSKTKICKNRSKTIFMRNLFRRSSFYSIDRGKCGFEYQKASVFVQYNQTFSLEYTIFFFCLNQEIFGTNGTYILLLAPLLILWFFCDFSVRLTCGRLVVAGLFSVCFFLQFYSFLSLSSFLFGSFHFGFFTCLCTVHT